MIHISVINASTIVPDHEVEAALPALQTQVRRDYAPVWGTDAELSFARRRQPRAGAWWLVIHDHASQADMDGVHELTNQGLPPRQGVRTALHRAGRHMDHHGQP